MGAAKKLDRSDVIKNFSRMTIKELAGELAFLIESEGSTIAEVAKQVGYHRTNISTFINQHTATDNVRQAVIVFLNKYYDVPQTNIREYKQSLELFPTDEFKKALGFIDGIKRRQKMGCLIGYPGSGKTTTILEYAKSVKNVVYVEAFQGMREKDLLEIIAENLGIILKSGSSYKQIKQIIDEYDDREIMFIIDESEYLKKWDVSKFDTLRKLWSNTQIPILLVGTKVLEDYLTHGGSGKENLSQLYRRMYKMRLEGIKEHEVRSIIQNYHVDKEAENLLVALAIDYKHGGMGNFTEVLELCLEEADGMLISSNIVRNAKNYKLLY